MIYDPVMRERVALSKDPSQRTSYDPDWVLRHLLNFHPEFLAQNIKQVLADCAPYDEEVYDPIFAFTWVWIVELLPSRSQEKDDRYTYVIGWFDPRLWEPVTHLQAWFFTSPEEALACAKSSMIIGKGKTTPNQKLYDFLKTQLDQGKMVRKI